jgi:cell division protein FtsQ
MIPGSFSKDDEILIKPRKRNLASSSSSHHESHLLHWLSRLLLLSLLVCLGYAGREILLNPDYFPLNSIKVSGEFKHINAAAVSAQVKPYLQQGFFGVNTSALQDELQQLPWVDKVVVKRVWPQSVAISMSELRPVAHWNGNALLSGQGQVFTPPDANAQGNLPYFIGPLSQQVLMLQTYGQLNPLVKSLNLSIKQLYLTDRHAWQLQLDNGIIVNLGNQNMATRLSRFTTIYKQLFADKAAAIAYIDMRYSNGIAVKWKNSERA